MVGSIVSGEMKRIGMMAASPAVCWRSGRNVGPAEALRVPATVIEIASSSAIKCCAIRMTRLAECLSPLLFFLVMVPSLFPCPRQFSLGSRQPSASASAKASWLARWSSIARGRSAAGMSASFGYLLMKSRWSSR